MNSNGRVHQEEEPIKQTSDVMIMTKGNHKEEEKENGRKRIVR